MSPVGIAFPINGGRPILAPLMTRLSAAAPAMIFGFRLWASVCLALYVAFWLQLDNAYWAGTSAAVVCQPQLGASLRKGWFRTLGTLVGATAIVVLTACFPQDRAGFLVGVALWGGGCALAASLLRNFASQGAALAGTTAAIIASDQLGATGGVDGQAFMLAVARAAEICIGIVCAGVVLAGTDLGGARRRLAQQFASISAEISERFVSTFSLSDRELGATQTIRRALIGRVIALDPNIDAAIGESSTLRHNSPVLRAAVRGLVAALAGWRTVTFHLMALPSEAAAGEAKIILRELPPELREAPETTGWVTNPTRLRRSCEGAMGALIALPADGASLRLLADHTADGLAGICRALDGVALLVGDTARPLVRRGRTRFHVPDWLPSVVNGARAFVTIAAVEMFWIISAWPNGAQAITFAAVVVIVLSPRADQAYAAALSFMVGIGLATVLAAIIKFAVLPELTTFAGFCLAIGVVLVPAGALIAQPWQTAMFTALASFGFVSLLAPANLMSYDTRQFYNAALAIVAGTGVGALSFRLLPPLSPAFRARRLLALTLRDLRRLAANRISPTPDEWLDRVYSRLFVLPDAAEPLQRGRMVVALSLGAEIIQLRRVTRHFGLGSDLDAALEAMVRGNSATATDRLARLDHALRSISTEAAEAFALRARGIILAMSEALTEHAAWFDAEAAR